MRRGGGSAGPGIAPLFLAATWAFSPFLAGYGTNGLESSLSILLIAATWLAQERLRPSGRLWARDGALLFGLLVGLSCVARIDNLILAGILWIWLAFRSRAPARLLARGSGWMLAGAAAVAAPWALYIHGFTGDWLPVSGDAVRFLTLAGVDHHPTWSNWVVPNLNRAARLFAYPGRTYTVVAGLLLAGALLVRSSRGPALRALGSHAPLILFSIAIFGIYTLYIGAWWYFPRYLLPAMVVLLLVLARLAEAILGAVPERARPLAALALLALCVLGPNRDGRNLETLLLRSCGEGYRPIALWARAAWPEGTRIGGCQSGALGYYADRLVVVNLDGVVNRACLESLRARRNLEYIAGCGVEYVIGWDVNLEDLREHSAGIREDDLVPVDGVPEIRTWGLPWRVVRLAAAAERRRREPDPASGPAADSAGRAP
jgi:hypothetical protein